jgi:hypothetical protein
MGDSMSTIINATTTNGVVIQPDNSGSLQLQTNNGTTALTIDTSQRAAFVAGTAALPAITTTGDTNTGIFFPAADTIAFSEGGAEAMRLDSSGNVGIGATSPGQKLDISTSGDIQARIGNSATGAQFTYDIGRVAASGLLQFYGNQSGATGYIFSGINGERMRIDSSGNLLINRTSTFSTSGGDTPKLYSTGALAVNSGATVSSFSSDRINFNASTFFVLGSSTGGGVKLDNGTTAWAAQSDETTKDIIEPISNAVEKVTTLRAVIGKYKEDVEGTRRSFLIAQDVKNVLPEAVSISSDGLLSLRYTEVIPLLVAAVTEQQQIITDLKATVDAQSVTINDLKARVETLEAK